MITGVHYDSLRELTKEKITDLNQFLEDEKESQFYSITGDKMQDDMPDLFKNTSSSLFALKENENSYFCDGLFFEDETSYFNHEYQLHADHFDLSPFSSKTHLIEAISKILAK